MTKNVEKWDYFELELKALTSGNPFLDVVPEVDFTHNHRSVRVTGFYDGGDVYKTRFMPDMEGDWRYVTHSNVGALDNQSGSFECTPPSGHNHGPVRVIDRAHFAYADGKPYHPVGTTCYVWNLQGDELEEQTLATLKTAPFNKMRMCVFPKRYSFNSNEPPCYPFEGKVKRPAEPATQGYWDFMRFNPEYFRRLERRVLDLRELGIEADLILFHPYDAGAWGFDKMPTEVNDRCLKYLAARISAFRNLWWSLANEFDLMAHRTLADWDHYFQLVQDCDPYDHLRSIHNCHSFYDHGKPWVTHCSIQHHDLMQVPTWLQQYGKPVVVDECGYEGDIHLSWGDLSAEEMVHRFWLGFAAGGYVGHGETYVNEKEILWWSKGGTLSGESPKRIAFLRKIIEAVPAPGLYPAPRRAVGGINPSDWIVPGGPSSHQVASHNGADYYLFYFGMHQPRCRYFTLPQGCYRIDIIDAWNMTVERFADAVSGEVRVELPLRKYLAIRIEKNS
jgi:Domain of unknown function (DUF5605)/Domain of unknown function (DUF5060)/Protein of unknown function (DUF4038)